MLHPGGENILGQIQTPFPTILSLPLSHLPQTGKFQWWPLVYSGGSSIDWVGWWVDGLEGDEVSVIQCLNV